MMSYSNSLLLVFYDGNSEASKLTPVWRPKTSLGAIQFWNLSRRKVHAANGLVDFTAFLLNRGSGARIPQGEPFQSPPRLEWPGSPNEVENGIQGSLH
jgi:hypothetical protein